MRQLRRAHPDVRLARGAAPTMEWLSPEDYQALLRRHGFEVAHCSLDEARMTLESFRDIGHYSLFIEGALPGAPLAPGPRRWAWVPARRSRSSGWRSSRAGGSSWSRPEPPRRRR